MLDYAYRTYGDRDLQYGYRLCTAQTPELRQALLHMQQRRHVDTLKYLSAFGEQFESEGRKRGREWESELVAVQRKTEEGLVNEMAKECFKNLNQWDEIVDRQTEDMDASADYLFHSSGNKERISNVITQLDRCSNRQFSYYYGKSILNFLESSSSQNK